MPEIAVEVADKDAREKLEQIAKDANGFMAERRGIDGVALSTVVLTLGPLIIHGLVKIVQAQVDAKKHVRVIVDGLEIRGVSEDALIQILKINAEKKPAK